MISLQDKALLIKLYYTNGVSATVALRRFRSMKHIKCGRGPLSPSGLRRVVKRFEETGRLAAGPRSGRPSASTTVSSTIQEHIDDVAASSPYGIASARAVSRIAGIAVTTVWRTLRMTLRRYPYKIQHVHQQLARDAPKRETFARWAFSKMEQGENWLFNVFWTDEAHFSLHGGVNSHNCRIWATANPHVYEESPLQSPKVTVWCGFTASFLLGPFFFEERCATGLQTCTITGTHYRALLRTSVLPNLQERNALHNIVFMHDGAPPHTARQVMEMLRSTFGADRLLSRHSTHAWPPRSPDLTPADFWLWGYLKSRVYRGNPQSLSSLKDAIRQEVSAIPVDMLFNAVSGVVPRLHAVLECGGGHIEHLQL